MLPTTAAGIPPIRTVGTPGGTIGVGGWGPAGGGKEHVCMSPTRAAGRPPMSTVGQPGGMITPGWGVVAPTLATNRTTFALQTDGLPVWGLILALSIGVLIARRGAYSVLGAHQ